MKIMSEEKNLRKELEEKHGFLFGKAPSKRMKTVNLEKKVNAEINKRGGTTEDVPKEPEYGSTAINELMETLSVLSKEEAGEDSLAMITMVLGKKGIHMSMLGEGQDVAIMLATAMSSQPMIDAVITNASMMSQMRKSQVAEQLKGNGVLNLEKPKTEA